MANANFIVQNGISIGGSSGATITADPTTGAVAIAPAATAAVPNPTATVFTTAGTTTTVATTGGTPTLASLATASNTATAGSGLTTLGNVTIGNIYVNNSTGTAGQFLSSNGAGLTWQTLSASSISNGTSNVTVGSGSITLGINSGNVMYIQSATVGAGNVWLNGSILPGANIAYTLGSTTKMWKDIFVGPGSLYVNGKQVLSDNSGTIQLSTDIDQNLSIRTSGTGDIQVNPSGTGTIALQGTIKVTAGKNFTSSDGNAIGFANQIAVDSITSKSANTDLTVTAAGTGKVYINDDCTITGNLTISGTTTTVNTSTLSVADNIIDLNSDVTTGTPTEDAGIRILRGDSSAVQLKWAETVDTWQLTNDGSTYANIVTTSGAQGTGVFTTLSASGVTSVTNNTASSGTGTGALVVTGGVGVGGAMNVGANVTVTGSVLPSANVTYNLGSPTARWKDLYLSGTTIDLGGTTMSAPAGGGFAVTTGNIVAGAATVSTSTTTGSLIAAGGVGVVGNLNVGGQVTSGTHLPSGNVTVNLGSTTAYWNNIYASSINAVGITVNSGKILPGANAVVDIGSTTAWFNTIYGKSTQAQYADLAENYQADRAYAPGTVVMFGGSAEVTVADSDTTRVAGVVSTNPAHLMNGGLQGTNIIPLALQGRVPCQVIGPVRKGDLMVSAGHGYAKVNNSAGVGQVIGKALQEVTFPGKAVIEVVVGRV